MTGQFELENFLRNVSKITGNLRVCETGAMFLCELVFRILDIPYSHNMLFPELGKYTRLKIEAKTFFFAGYFFLSNLLDTFSHFLYVT